MGKAITIDDCKTPKELNYFIYLKEIALYKITDVICIERAMINTLIRQAESRIYNLPSTEKDMNCRCGRRVPINKVLAQCDNEKCGKIFKLEK